MGSTASVERLRDLDFFSLVEAEGTKVEACICLKGSFRDDGAFLGSEKGRKPLQNAAWKVQNRGEEKEVPSKGILVVQQVTQRDSGSAHGFEFQGEISEHGKKSVKLWKCWCECWVGRKDVCLQAEGKKSAGMGQCRTAGSRDS